MGESSGEGASSAGPRFREILERRILFDDEGFFTDFEDWSEAVFAVLAAESGISPLTDSHRRVVRFFRDYYACNGRAPMNREVREGIAMSILELERLFPEGIKKGARRLAGLPNPKTCN
ncbi:MAG: TusE/DsrC/DsvC family sulfur relay protein [Pseudomonadota bacterium]